MKDREEYISILEQDNAELKKQLEQYKGSQSCSFVNICKNVKIANYNQQKKFINYLEDEIYNIEPKGTGINYNCEYDSEEDYVMTMEEQSRLNTLKEILQKYKEIIGVENEKK